MSRYSSSWTPLPALPDPEGFAGMYAGTCGEIMICAGGTNFPEKPMLEGGAKTWTDRIFTLSPGENEWKEAGTLPVPYAYGASAGIREGLLCIGGCGKEGHRKDVYLLNLAKGTVTTHPFPSSLSPWHIRRLPSWTGKSILQEGANAPASRTAPTGSSCWTHAGRNRDGWNRPRCRAAAASCIRWPQQTEPCTCSAASACGNRTANRSGNC